MLLVVAHPTIGAALATLLGMEARYEVVRVQSLDQAEAALKHWRPDAALVDGLLLKAGPAPRIEAPSYVLSGSAADGQGLVRRLPDARGWLRKDATAGELRAAIDAVLTTPARGPRRRTLATASAVALSILAIVAAFTWAWAVR